MRERKKLRLQGYDYSSDNLYYVTSCTQNRIHHFGEIENKKMILNANGEIALRQWIWLTEQYKYAISHAFVVMPNHIHAILEINGNVGNGRDRSLQPKIKSLSELMGAYKTTTSKQIHLMGNGDFLGQKSFHDHIIRDYSSYLRIRDYIIDNPERWEEDPMNNS